MVQECLTNTLKHAVDPRQAHVEVQVTDEVVVVEVSDDGRSRGTSRAPAVPGGNGLRGIRERGRMYDAELSAGPGTGIGDRPGWVVLCRLTRESHEEVTVVDQRAARR
jgi:signal transduction histidine kinase